MKICASTVVTPNNPTQSASKARYEKVALAVSIVSALILAAGIVTFTQNFLPFPATVTLMAVGGFFFLYSTLSLIAARYGASKSSATNGPVDKSAPKNASTAATVAVTRPDPIIERTIPLEGRSRTVEFASKGSLTIQKGDTYSLKVKGPQSFIEAFKPDEGWHSLGIKDALRIIDLSGSKPEFTLTIQAPLVLVSVVNEGEGDIFCHCVDSLPFKVSLTTTKKGTIVASGKCKKLDIHILGDGHIDCSGITCEKAKLDIPGSGDETQELTVKIGNVTEEISGSITRGKATCTFSGAAKYEGGQGNKFRKMES